MDENFDAESAFPQELYDLVIDHCHYDKSTLKKCSLVCRNWLHRAHMHLFERLHLHFRRAFELVTDYVERLKLNILSSSRIFSYVCSLTFDFGALSDSVAECGIWEHIVPFLPLTTLRSLKIIRSAGQLMHDPSLYYQKVVQSLIRLISASPGLEKLVLDRFPLSMHTMDAIFSCISRPDSKMKILSIFNSQPMAIFQGDFTRVEKVKRGVPLGSLYLRDEPPMTLFNLALTWSNFHFANLTLLSAICVSNLSCVMTILEHTAQTITHLVVDLRWTAQTDDLIFPETPKLTHLHLIDRHNTVFLSRILQTVVRSDAKMQYIHISLDFWAEHAHIDDYLVEFIEQVPSLQIITVFWASYKERNEENLSAFMRLIWMLPKTSLTGKLEVAPAPRW